MKELFDIKLHAWFENKQHASFIAASINPDYKFEVIKETEKAIQIDIINEHKMINNWTMWIPKSAIRNLDEVLA